jgi:peroxiredoxin
MDRKIYLVAFIAVLSGLGAIIIWASTPAASPGIKVGDVAVDFTALDPTGTKITLASMKGKSVVIDFMTSNCPACLEQAKQLGLVKQRSDLVIFSVVLDSQMTAEGLSEMVKTHGVTWVLGWSPPAGAAYKVNVVPTVLIIDPEGVIRYKGTYTTAGQIESILISFR